MLATIVGIILTVVISVLFFFALVGSIAGSKEKVTILKPNSVYELKLEGNLVDRSKEDDISATIAEAFGQGGIQTLGLNDVLANIRKAKEDPNIVGIYLNGGELSAGIASVKEIRDALIDFKKSGKFIVAYADGYTQKMYYLVSVADKLLLNAQGAVDLKGLSGQVTFYKNTLDKLGIEMQVVRVGSFKSAVEPFIATKMSDENRMQVNVFLGSIWDTMLHEISSARKIPTDSLNKYADMMMNYQPVELTRTFNLVDELVYVQDVDSVMKKCVKNLPKDEDVTLVSSQEMKRLPDTQKLSKSKIAVIYAAGEITDSQGDGIVARDLIGTIDAIAKDSAVKAVVFRVNSPGGSAYASEQIWHSLFLLKKKKPLIVSMGDYAASGGYYISCMADKVLAQPNTITGSIGIFGIIPNVKGLTDKIGLTNDVVKTNKMSDAININRAFTPEERNLMQNYVNKGYDLFVKRCADGRKMTPEQIKNIAEGRVWTGKDALRIGLVDKLGGLTEAIAVAAGKAKLKAYNVVEYPETEDLTSRLMKSLSKDVETRMIKAQLGENFAIFKQVQELGKQNGIQARMSYDLDIR